MNVLRSSTQAGIARAAKHPALGAGFMGKALSLLSLTLLGVASTDAATIVKLNNTTRIDSGTSWVDGVAPGSADVGLFDNTITGSLNTGNLSGNYSIGSFQFTGMGGAVTVGVTTAGGSTALTLNSGGIDMSAATQDVTFGSVVDGGQVRIASALYNAQLNVAAGRTLTFNSRFTNQGNTKTVFLTGGGSIIFNASNGGGGAMSFDITGGTTVTINGTGGWASGNDVINGTLYIGNDSALGGSALGLGGTNSVTPTIAASGGPRTIANAINLNAVTTGNATIAGSNALTVNGGLNVVGGNRTLTVNNTQLTSFAGTVSLANTNVSRMLTVNGSGNTEISGQVVNGSTATASSLAYTGTGTLTLSHADNTYGGTTTVTSGTLLVNGGHTGAGDYSVSNAGTRFGGNGSITGAAASSITLGAGTHLVVGTGHNVTATADNVFLLQTINGSITSAADVSLKFDLFDDGVAGLTGAPVSYVSTANDLLDLNVTSTGAVNFSGIVDLAVNVANLDSSIASQNWKIIDWAGLSNLGSITYAPTTIGDFTFTGYTIATGTDAGFYINAATTVVPEPSRALLLLGGAFGLLCARRRR